MLSFYFAQQATRSISFTSLSATSVTSNPWGEGGATSLPLSILLFAANTTKILILEVQDEWRRHFRLIGKRTVSKCALDQSAVCVFICLSCVLIIQCRDVQFQQRRRLPNLYYGVVVVVKTETNVISLSSLYHRTRSHREFTWEWFMYARVGAV